MNAKPISKTAQLKLDREARKQARQQAPLRLAAARDEAFAACRCIPPELQALGVVRTRAFMNMVEILFYRAGLKTIKADALEAYTAHLRRVSTMPVDQCQELSGLNVRQRLGTDAD